MAGRSRVSGGKRGVIKALSWKQVNDISNQFATLNPYDREAVPRSILKIEDDNYDDPEKREHQRQLYCLAISAKRYALFLRDRRGSPVLLRKNVNNKEDRWSEHGLGHLLNPTDPESEDRGMDRASMASHDSQRDGTIYAEPEFRTSTGGWSYINYQSRRHATPCKAQRRKEIRRQDQTVQFFGDLPRKAFGHPPGVDAEHFHLIAPYESDSREWLKKTWIDQYSGNDYRITTTGHHGDRHTARVKTYGEVLREYEVHPESKCADASGEPCGKQTVGLLQRRHVRIDEIKYMGKESNSLEEVDAGLVQSAENVYTIYTDPRRDEWQTKILPALKKIPLPILVKMSGLSRRTLIDIRAGRSRPHRKNREMLVGILRKLGLL